MKALELLPVGWPCDPRPLLLAAAMTRRFTHLRLPPELEWARSGVAHCLPPVPDDVFCETWAVKADELYSPAQLSALADGGAWPEVQAATARTAYDWFHDTCLFAQLATGPVRLGRDEIPAGVDVILPQEGRGLWVVANGFAGGTADLWAVGRSVAGAVAVESLGRCPARLDALTTEVSPPPSLSSRTAFQLAELALRVTTAARRRDWGTVGRLVNSAWAIERTAGASGGDLAVLAALEGGDGKRGARPSGSVILTVGETV